MSYEKAKHIQIKKNEIYITSTCNNDTAGYSKWKYQGNIIDLFISIIDGNIQPLDSCNNGKIKFIEYKLREFVKTIKVEGEYLTWNDRNLLKESKEFQNKIYELLDYKNKDKFILKFQEYFITKILKRGFYYGTNKNDARKLNFFQAFIQTENRNDLTMEVL